MESIQVNGKRLSASKVRGLLFSLANSISRNADLIGSIDANKYGVQCSFVQGDFVLGLSLSDMKGGAA